MRLAVIGCGGMGTIHAQLAANCGLEVAACADTHLHKAQELAARFGADATADSLALARRKDIDVVAVATPTPHHAVYVKAAAEAGKHIFCEKPFTRTPQEADETVAVVERAGVKLFVGHVVRYFQEFEAIRERIQAGSIGKIGFIKTYRGGIYPMGEDAWFRDYAQSGGVTYDSSIHDFDWLRYVFGNPERVYCQALQRPEPLDYAMVTMWFRQGMISHTIGTWAHPGGFRVKVEACGDQGMITLDSNEAPISSRMRQTAGGGPGMIVPASPVPVSPYQLEWDDFVSWMRDGRTPRVQPQDAAWAVRIAYGALESARTRAPVAL